MKNSLRIFVLAGIMLVVFSANVMALHIDFTDQQLFDGVQDQSFFATIVDTVGLSLTSEPENNGATMTWNSGDGIGIEYGYEYDEVEADEQLKIAFDNSVLLETIYLTDFFVESRSGDTYAETGTITLFGTDLPGGQHVLDITAYSPTAGTNGEFTLDLGTGFMVNEIQFEALGEFNGQDHDYSLAGVVVNTDVPPVPEPGTIMLLGIGILGSIGILRKRKG